MKIAMMVNGFIANPQPPRMTFAPMDIARALCDGLHKLGHHVTYFGPEGTDLHVPVVTSNLQPFPLNRKGFPAYPGDISFFDEQRVEVIRNQLVIGDMLTRAAAGDFDALLIHIPDCAMPLVRLSNVPTAYILHDPIVPWRRDSFTRLGSDNQTFIAISDAQRRPAPELPYLATIHNGIDLSTFPFTAHHDGHLLFVGRMMPQKGAADAVNVAERTNLPLKLYGELTQDDPDYFVRRVKPRLNNHITYEGFIPRRDLAKEYRSAKALLVPIHWEEPFGLTLIEAMACGTPVIAFRHGAVPEIVVDGETGFIVDTVEEMVEAVKKIDTIDRRACRRHVETYFSNLRMVKQYEEALQRLITPERKTSLPQNPSGRIVHAVEEVKDMDGLTQVVQVPGDMNPDPRGLDNDHAQPRGGLRFYQDDIDTNKEDVATEDTGDDPSTRLVEEPTHQAVMTEDDVREEVEDRDEADRE